MTIKISPCSTTSLPPFALATLIFTFVSLDVHAIISWRIACRLKKCHDLISNSIQSFRATPWNQIYMRLDFEFSITFVLGFHRFWIRIRINYLINLLIPHSGFFDNFRKAESILKVYDWLKALFHDHSFGLHCRKIDSLIVCHGNVSSTKALIANRDLMPIVNLC